jgi:hypothetical protein
MDADRWFERVAEEEDHTRRAVPAPARLKARIYSALVERAQEEGRLLSLSATRAAGRDLCIFERALELLPTGNITGSMNPCRICHARVLAERLEHAPVFWPNCPYSAFHHPGD